MVSPITIGFVSLCRATINQCPLQNQPPGLLIVDAIEIYNLGPRGSGTIAGSGSTNCDKATSELEIVGGEPACTCAKVSKL
jgi:hypothetical protein